MLGQTSHRLASSTTYPPINFIYAHFHNSIRAELDSLAARVRSLDGFTAVGLEDRLHDLRDRYRFLEQVYKYHSAVEDEVVYPILDAKVKNVTLAYSVEHQDEEFLFEQLLKLLATALEDGESARQGTIRTLICKVEEIHTTLRKHLAKEEEQLLPLLLQHFSFAEQAELVAQFLYSIPLETVERVLAQLKPMIPKNEQEQLLEEIRAVIPDNLLSQLLTTWLQPADDIPAEPAPQPPAAAAAAAAASPHDAHHSAAAMQCCGDPSTCPFSGQQHQQQRVTGVGAPGASMDSELPASSGRAPLQEIIHFHRSICSALEEFVQEARALQSSAGEITASQLSSLLERHRFLRSVYVFHSISEEEVMFPELQRLAVAAAAGVGGAAGVAGASASSRAAAYQCEKDHQQELSSFEDLGRLLADVRAFARRGRKEVGSMLEKLCSSAEAVRSSIVHHMQREEQDVFPLLEASLCEAQQRAMVYRTIRAMPLRLLERVMPWVVSKLNEDDASALLANIRLGAPSGDLALVELLTRWARRGRRMTADGGGPEGSDGVAPGEHGTAGVSDHLAQCTATCGPRFLRERSALPDEGCGGAWLPAAKRSRTTPRATDPDGMRHAPSPEALAEAEGTMAQRRNGAGAGCSTSGRNTSSSGGGSGGGSGYSPIDHIFQFHKALRQELRQLERDAMALEHALLGPGGRQGAITQQQQGQGQGAQLRQQGWAGGSGPSVSAFLEPQAQQALASLELADGPDADAGGTAAAAAALPCFRACGGGGTEPGESTAVMRARVLPALQQLHGRFQFLQGIYRAHSKAEDEIVFPALEAKQALRNVSHAYTLDHRQEEQLFVDLEEVIESLRGSSGQLQLSEKVMSVRAMCAAIRASLETHIRSEESELWPLFTEHFSTEEQQYLVGVIIGRTGAQVLQALLPWVSETFSAEEKDAMMDSLRAATRNTMFDQWLEAVQGGGGAAGLAAAAAGQPQPPPPPQSADAGTGQGEREEQAERGGEGGASAAELERPLQHIAEYLGGGDGGAGGSGQEGAGSNAAAGCGPFRPGWEDIFRMNQQQLEAAIHRVSNDPNLEPERKAYLMQNIMVSKYIVAQQRRMQASRQESGDMACGTDRALGQLPTGGGAGSGAAGAAGLGLGLGAVASVVHPPQRTYHNATTGVLGCQHYQRKCRLLAPCCKQTFTCRLCHDEASEHRMDRYAVSEMQCMVCGLQQPVAGACANCARPMARYYCSICHLFDDAPGKDIYHCPFCNVCRRGKGLGIDFFHCMNCNACMSLSLFSSHKCREKCIEGNCPVCHEALFDSSQPIKELPCGHFMHSSCFQSYTRYNYTCPMCSKSVGDMSVYFQMLDSLLASERLPPEYAGRMQQVLCNDCGKMGFAPFHFVYHACPHCRSYNTRVL